MGKRNKVTESGNRNCGESGGVTHNHDYTVQPTNSEPPPQCPPSENNILFVGNLSFFCKEIDLLQLFDQYTRVTNARIVYDTYRTHRSLMFGFVTIETAHEAKEMARVLNTIFFMGRQLKVSLSGDQTRRRSVDEVCAGSQVHVAFSTPANAEPIALPTESWLRKHFSRYGVVLDCQVKEYTQYKTAFFHEGYGFIVFSSYEVAIRVIQEVQEIVVDGITLLCKPGKLLPDVSEANTASKPRMVSSMFDSQPSASFDNYEVPPPLFPPPVYPPLPIPTSETANTTSIGATYAPQMRAVSSEQLPIPMPSLPIVPSRVNYAANAYQRLSLPTNFPSSFPIGNMPPSILLPPPFPTAGTIPFRSNYLVNSVIPLQPISSYKVPHSLPVNVPNHQARPSRNVHSNIR